MLLCAALASVLPPVPAGEIYRTVDEDGRTVFTDEPPDEDAEPLRLPPITTIPAPATSGTPPRSEVTPVSEPARDERVSGVDITFPPAGEAIRRVAGQVEVRVRLEPAGLELPQDYQVEIHVDGELAGTAGGREVTVGPLHPGPHSLQAVVIDAAGGRVAESATVDFHLIRQTVTQE